MQRWEKLVILNALGSDIVYAVNLLVQPISERADLMAKSNQSHMNFESIFASQRKCWWWPLLKQEIKEEWEKCKQPEHSPRASGEQSSEEKEGNEGSKTSTL